MPRPWSGPPDPDTSHIPVQDRPGRLPDGFPIHHAQKIQHFAVVQLFAPEGEKLLHEALGIAHAAVGLPGHGEQDGFGKAYPFLRGDPGQVGKDLAGGDAPEIVSAGSGSEWCRGSCGAPWWRR